MVVLRLRQAIRLASAYIADEVPRGVVDSYSTAIEACATNGITSWFVQHPGHASAHVWATHAHVSALLVYRALVLSARARASDQRPQGASLVWLASGAPFWVVDQVCRMIAHEPVGFDDEESLQDAFSEDELQR